MKKIFMALTLLLSAFALADVQFSEDEFKFYDNGELVSKVQLAEIYPDYEIITISHFNNDKKYTIKNSVFKSKKYLLLNDTNRTFHGFEIYPESSRGEIKSLITVYGKKNVRLKHSGGDEFEIVVK